MKTLLVLFSVLGLAACVQKAPVPSREPSAVRVATPVDLKTLFGRYKAIGECEIDEQEVSDLRILADRGEPGVLNLLFFGEEVMMHQIRAGHGRTRDFSAPFPDGFMEWSTSVDGQVLKSTEMLYRQKEPAKKFTRNFTIALLGRNMSLSYESNAPEEKADEDENSSSKKPAEKKEEKGNETHVCRFFRR